MGGGGGGGRGVWGVSLQKKLTKCSMCRQSRTKPKQVIKIITASSYKSIENYLPVGVNFSSSNSFKLFCNICNNIN